MLYFCAVGTSLLLLMPVITCGAAEPVAFEVPMGPDGIQRAVVEADSYEFSPRHLVVQAGKPVELTVKSVTVLVPHNFLIDDPKSGLAIKEEIPAGQTVKITFTPTVPGSFAIYCDKKLLFFKSHREKGMEGILEVR
jgi:plastocyanin